MDGARVCRGKKRVRRRKPTAYSQQPTARKDGGGFHHPSAALRAGRERRGQSVEAKMEIRKSKMGRGRSGKAKI
jgi:hypothetical protein